MFSFSIVYLLCALLFIGGGVCTPITKNVENNLDEMKSGIPFDGKSCECGDSILHMEIPLE